jgi:heat shock protein HslJ
MSHLSRPVRGVVALLLVVVIAGCGGAEPEPAVERPATPPAGEARAADAGPDAAAELAGTAWVLEELNGRAPLVGTVITVDFADGLARGNTGCNGYGTAYSGSRAGEIGFDVLEMTEIGCVEPPGVMGQEKEYAAALEQSSGYRLESGRLALLDAAGGTVLEFVAAPAK